jgi:hypothetical protein
MQLEVKEQLIDSSNTIERTIYLGENAVAIVYFDKRERNCTLVWPLSTGTSLRSLIDTYVTRFLEENSTKRTGTRLEYWRGDYHGQRSFSGRLRPAEILNELDHDANLYSETLDLVQLWSENNVFEVLFDSHARPCRLALVMSVVPIVPLMRLFARFHRDDAITHRYPSLFATNFVTDALVVDATKMFSPFPLIQIGGSHGRLQTRKNRKALPGSESE